MKLVNNKLRKGGVKMNKVINNTILNLGVRRNRDWSRWFISSYVRLVNNKLGKRERQK